MTGSCFGVGTPVAVVLGRQSEKRLTASAGGTPASLQKQVSFNFHVYVLLFSISVKLREGLLIYLVSR